MNNILNILNGNKTVNRCSYKNNNYMETILIKRLKTPDSYIKRLYMHYLMNKLYSYKKRIYMKQNIEFITKQWHAQRWFKTQLDVEQSDIRK